MSTWTTLLELGLGRRCLACHAPGPAWCDTCVARSHDPHQVRTPGGRLVQAAADYDGAVRAAILAHKEQRQLALSRPLGRLLASALRAAVPSGPAQVVPAPSRRSAVRRRGQDHARRLARAGAAWCREDVVGGGRPVLGWRFPVADQGGLDADRRAANVLGAMSARPPRYPGTPAVLVDDIVTTGATVDEAHRALELAGWWVVGAAVVASVSPRWGVARTRRLG